jgi:superfamily II DNA or RNA helicase
MNAKLYQLSSGFASAYKYPIFFVGVQLGETSKAVFLYGQGTTETAKMGVCCVCGRKLTHPVSVELGIGPECGKHYHNWDLVGGYSLENIERLRQVVQSKVVVNSWIPKAVIKQVVENGSQVDVPADHAMLIAPKTNSAPRRVEFAINAEGDRVLRIIFPFDRDELAKVQIIPGRRYHSEMKCWSAPALLENLDALLARGYVASEAVKEWRVQETAPVQEVQEIPGLKTELFPFQKEGVQFIEARRGRALIADEMGLGKTIQALAWLQLHPEFRPAIVVAPASLKLNWAKEALKWLTPCNVQVLSGTSPGTIYGDILIVNYDVVAAWLDVLQGLKPSVLIMDEIHYIKNTTAIRTKAVKALAKGIPHIIGLSGTPIVNRPVEAFNAIKIINPNAIGSFWQYTQRYCGAKRNGFGWDFSGATNTEELHEKLTQTIMIRRKKSEVLAQLPEKVRTILPLELSNVQEYNKAEGDFIGWVTATKGEEAAKKTAGAEVLTQIEVLKQLAVKGKLNQAISWIQNFLEVDGKLVVFAVHKFVIDALMEAFSGKVVKIDGSVSQQDRDAAVTEFQTNPAIRLFVGNIKAAGVGLTLTAASNVAIMELPWTPGELVQAEDRCHRIGQKNAVIIHYLLAAGTIEERIARLIDGKRRILDMVLDGEQTEESSLLTELMSTYSIS